MKKVTEIIKPLLVLIFGALALLFFINGLGGQGEYLAFSIIAVIFSSYYLAAGILNVVLGNKLNNGIKLVFDILNVSLFPALMLFMRILEMKQSIQNDNMSPTDWIVDIIFMVSTVCLIVFYIVSRFVKQPIMGRLAIIFAGSFVLTLVVDIVLNNTVGSLPLIMLALYGLYAYILFSTLARTLQGDSPKEIE